MTKSGDSSSPGAITAEFVTSGYFGGLPGDPAKGATRVVTQNRAGPTFWVGQQANGSAFEPFWDKIGAVGHYDYGTLTMARTLGSDPNQVALNGRRVLVGWIGGTPASQSLARDLTLSEDYELLQQFVPELQVLRIPSSYKVSTAWNQPYKGNMQLEVVAFFTFSTKTPPTEPFGVEILRSSDGKTATRLQVDCSKGYTACVVGVDAGLKGHTGFGPLLPVVDTTVEESVTVQLHAIVDHTIVEAIFNNRTAMVVYAVPQAESDINVMLFGADSSTVTSKLETWELSATSDSQPNLQLVV